MQAIICTAARRTNQLVGSSARTRTMMAHDGHDSTPVNCTTRHDDTAVGTPPSKNVVSHQNQHQHHRTFEHDLVLDLTCSSSTSTTSTRTSHADRPQRVQNAMQVVHCVARYYASNRNHNRTNTQCHNLLDAGLVSALVSLLLNLEDHHRDHDATANEKNRARHHRAATAEPRSVLEPKSTTTPHVLLLACGVMGYLTRHCERAKVAWVQAGGAALTVALLGRFPHDAALHTAVAILLSNLGHDSPARQGFVVLAGGIPALLTSLQAHYEPHAVLSLNVCKCLVDVVGVVHGNTNTYTNNSSSSGGGGGVSGDGNRNAQAARDAGGLEILVQVARTPKRNGNDGSSGKNDNMCQSLARQLIVRSKLGGGLKDALHIVTCDDQ